MFDEFNRDLVQKRSKMMFDEYFDTFIETFCSHHDMEFRKYLRDIENTRDYFVVPFEKLVEFEIENIQELMKIYSLVESEDYSQKNHTIYFTNYSFKLLMIRSRNVKYVNYFIILEQCMNSYRKYLELHNNSRYFSWITMKLFRRSQSS